MSALGLCRWSQNGARLRGYVLSTQPVERPSFEEAPSRANCRAMPWLMRHALFAALPRAAFCGSGGWLPLLLALHTPLQPLSLVRAAGSWRVSALPWGFPGSGNALCTPRSPAPLQNAPALELIASVSV